MAEETKSQELLAIEQVAANVEKYKEQLGEKANKEDFEKLETAISELTKGLETMTGKQVTEKMETINSEMEKAFKQILDLQDQLNEQKEKTEKDGKKSNRLTKKEIEDFTKSFFEDGKKVRSQETLQIKAPEIMGYDQTFVDGTDISVFTGRVIDPELYQRKRKRNLILDNIPIISIDAPSLFYLEKEEIGTGIAPDNLSGSGDWILSGGEKPLRSFRLKTTEVRAKKVAIFSTVDDELLQDVTSFTNWVYEDLTDEMREAINDGLLNGNPAVDAEFPLGLKTNATQFVATPAFADGFDDPNYIDGIIAVIAMMADKKEMTGKVFVSSDVYYRIHNLKATDGKYINNNLIYVNNLGQLFIAGVLVESSDSDDIPSTHVLALSNDNPFKVRSVGSMVLESGLNDTDFRHDRTSFRGYQRFISYLPEHRENGVVYDTWANIFAELLEPASP